MTSGFGKAMVPTTAMREVSRTPFEPPAPERVDRDRSALLTADRVSKSYQSKRGSITALRDVSFVVRRGEIVCVVGASGCGKSTLLRVVAGLEPATTGEIRLQERRMSSPDPRISFVLQRPVLLPWLSVLGNVLVPAKLARAEDPSIRARALELLELVSLGGFENNWPRELSGGMQSRASLARALLLDPEILLMDEPFAALDALTRERMAAELEQIIQKTAKTIVFVTHSIPEAVLLGDRVVVMSERPGTVTANIEINIERPRTTATMESRAFLDAATAVRSALELGTGDRS